MSTLGTAPWAPRRWRRIERRAIAGHERDLLGSLRALAAAGTPVVAVDMATGPAGTIVSLVLPQHRLTLAGVAASAAHNAGLAGPVRDSRRALTLAATGRYGPWWWLTATGVDGSFTLLGSHVQLVAGPGRPRAHPGPGGWGAPSTRLRAQEAPVGRAGV